MNQLTPLLAIALLLVGCACPVPEAVSRTAGVCLSPAFSPSEQAALLESVDRWEADSSGAVALRARVGSGCTVDVAPGELPANILGATDLGDRTARIIVNAHWLATDTGDEHATHGLWLTNIGMHEFGHALGLWHEPGTLMRAAGYGGAHVDAATLASLGVPSGAP